MSHTSVYKAKMKDLGKVQQACNQFGATFRKLRTGEVAHMYGSQTVDDVVAVFTPVGWSINIAVKSDGNLVYDHFGSKVGSMENLYSIVQDYNKQVIIDELGLQENVSNYWTEQGKDGAIDIVVEYAD